MASTYTSNQGLEKPATGDRSGTWGTMTNTNMDILDRAISGVGALSLTGTTTTLTTSEGSASDGNYKVLVLGGSPSGTNTITLSPNDADKLYFVVNSTGQSVIFSQGTGANVTIANGAADIIYADGAGSGAAVSSYLANDFVFKTGDGVILNLQTSDTTVTASSVLGRLNFTAPDEASGTDAILLAASIAAISEGTFAADNNATKLSFMTGASEAAAEKMSISSVGNVTMKQTATGDDTPMTLSLTTGEVDIAASDVLGKIEWSAPDEGAGTDALLVAGAIDCVSEGDFSSSSNASKLSFRTGASETATEKMQISSTGNVTMKQTATGDDTPMTLLLQTGETDIAAADILGKIEFQAPDEATGTDATLVAGAIDCVSEGDFSSSSNASKLSFRTGASETATEKMQISSVGNVTMKQTATGDDTPMTLLLQTGETDIAAADILGKIQFQAPDEAAGTDAILVAAEIAAVSEGDFSSSSNATKLSFKTGSSEAAAEKMSLSSGGNLTINGAGNVVTATTSSALNAGGYFIASNSSHYSLLGYSTHGCYATSVYCVGALYKGSGTFRIPHGLRAGHDLLHSFIEGPQCDLIYRGRVDLVDGRATVSMDTKYGMTAGTFAWLTKDIQTFTSNETGWDAVKSSFSGDTITIECQNTSSTDTISWMVVAERDDPNIKASEITDSDGNLIIERPSEPAPPSPE